jgi:hypothetical protein
VRVIKYIGWGFAWLAAFLCALWAAAALYYDFPESGWVAAIVFLLVLLAAIIFVRGKLLKLSAVFRSVHACSAVVVNAKAE